MNRSLPGRVLAAGVAALLMLTSVPVNADEAKSVSPYAATPDSVVEKMLDLASVEPRDFVIDLGSGDGRMVIAAARRGARGLGVDIDAKLVEFATRMAAQEGVAERATFRLQDLFETDVGQASVITVYLLPSIMPRVAAKLRAELAPGTRVVVHDYPLPGWRIDRLESWGALEKRDINFNGQATIYLYTVPARTPRS